MVSERSSGHLKLVCVIGAGPAGLVAARELRREGHNVVVMEQHHDVGGQWLYQPNVENEDPLGKNKFPNVSSSIYSKLRLNLPREILGYTDFPFVAKKGRDMRRFPCHEEFFLYLKDFSEWFGLRDMIRFNTRVEYVGMLGDSCDNSRISNGGGVLVGGGDLKWVVKSREFKSDGDQNSKEAVEEIFDAVVVASGNFSKPWLPSIKGMDSWKGRQLHSHVYRDPAPFANEVVVVVGSSISGQDISVELVEVAKEVYLSSKTLDVFPGIAKVISKNQNFHLRLEIESLEEDGRVNFVDGSWIVADSIVYCTGYMYSYPFLDTKGIVSVDDNRVGPLYEHTFPPSLAPSLSFVGVPRKPIGFPFMESQSKWIAQILSGKKTLPSPEAMMDSINEFYKTIEAAGVPKSYTHSHDITNFKFHDKFFDNAGMPHLEEWRKELAKSALFGAMEDLETFRDSWPKDEELVREALQSPHYTQLGAEAL